MTNKIMFFISAIILIVSIGCIFAVDAHLNSTNFAASGFGGGDGQQPYHANGLSKKLPDLWDSDSIAGMFASKIPPIKI